MEIVFKNIRWVALLCLFACIAAMFLPMYESWMSDYKPNYNRPGLIKIYEMPEVGNMGVFNGFGSLFAYFNLTLITTQTVLHLFRANLKVTILIFSILFCLAIFITNTLGTMSWGGPVGSKMLIGYKVMIFLTSFLFFLSWIDAFRQKRNENLHPELLDQE